MKRAATLVSTTLVVVAGTVLMGVAGIQATAWVVSRFDTTLSAWWWFLLTLPFGVTLSAALGFFRVAVDRAAGHEPIAHG